MSETITIGNKTKEEEIKADFFKRLLGFGETGIGAFTSIINELIHLAKTNGLWGAVLGIIIVDLASHKVDPIGWRHQEVVSDKGRVATHEERHTIVLINHFIYSEGFRGAGYYRGVPNKAPSLEMYFATQADYNAQNDWFVVNSVLPNNELTIWRDGILSSQATLQISILIFSSIGIAEAATLIGTITSGLSITNKMVQNVAVPSITTLVEGNNQPTVDISKKT